jgi:hypothetical protein
VQSDAILFVKDGARRFETNKDGNRQHEREGQDQQHHTGDDVDRALEGAGQMSGPEPINGVRKCTLLIGDD